MATIKQTASLTVLVVEDDRCTRALLVLILERTGYQVITAEDGQEGLAEFERNTPDIIITDIKMPHMNGIELIRCVRRAAGIAANTPIIALTASDEETLAEAERAGADIISRKPGDIRRVPALIQELYQSKCASIAS
jgi:CheY-like chemotaxis protein